ncbi:MAG: hypothetical protein ACKOVA_05685 [Novosphingobium sp.]
MTDRTDGVAEPSATPLWAHDAAVMLGLGLLAFALRAWCFGNPNIHVDEQFYLLVGQRMAHGTLPYAGIFDVKPFGLFCIYALAAQVFSDSVVGYQVLATVSVWMTACLIYRIGRAAATLGAAAGGASAYVAWLAVFEGIGGQSPIFYNLPMVLAASIIVGMVRGGGMLGMFTRGAFAMFLVGCALQIKYSVVFEGIYFGIWLLWIARLRSGSAAGQFACRVGWMLAAVAPSVIGLIYFYANGAVQPYWQANFVSIFHREASLGQLFTALARLVQQQIALSPLWWGVVVFWRRKAPESDVTLFIKGWVVAAFGGYLLYGTWSEHFVLPLLPPLCIAAALALDQFAKPRTMALRLVAIGVIAGLARAATAEVTDGGAADVNRVAALVKPYLGKGCLYVVGAPASLYSLTGSCLATRFVFPSHLTSQRYAGTLGTDPQQAMRELIASRPSVIVKGKPYANPNVRNEAMLMSEIGRNYRYLVRMRIGVRWVTVWVRKAGT